MSCKICKDLKMTKEIVITDAESSEDDNRLWNVCRLMFYQTSYSTDCLDGELDRNLR